MNRTNLNRLISNYINAFDVINNDVHKEYLKWYAVKHFQDNWDIDAPDFSAMFKEAFKESGNLINNRMVQPVTGIIKLSEIPALTETVREMFRALLSDDGGDIGKRQDKIHAFLEKADELLNTYFKGSWKYAQDMRTAVSYLSFLEPDKNYMFKATQAKEFMYCAEYGDDFGSGESFSLKKYYRMCDGLVDVIKETPELIELHKSRMNDKMCSTDDYHILAYDIIYSAVVYNLYNDIEFGKEKKSNDRPLEQQRRMIMRGMSELSEKISNELGDALCERSAYDEFSAKGLEVYHKVFKEGVVVEHSGKIITVRFGDQLKKFQVPQSFSGGFLKTESTEITEIFNKMARLDDVISDLKKRQLNLQMEFKRLFY